jgi:hypothetical protein
MPISFNVPLKNEDSDALTINVATGNAYQVKIGKNEFYFVAHKSQYDTLRLSHFNSGWIAVRNLDEWTGTEAQKVGRALRRVVNRLGVKKFSDVLTEAPVLNWDAPAEFKTASIAPEPKKEAIDEGQGDDAICTCIACKGTGKAESSFQNIKEWTTCGVCWGLGEYRHAGFTELDRILLLIVSQQGKTKGLLKTSWSWKGEPKEDNHDRVTFNRAYYVWRWARFHGGEDVTLPFTAGYRCGSDPCKETIDRWANVVARNAFGTDKEGTGRWRDAFYGASR